MHKLRIVLFCIGLAPSISAGTATADASPTSQLYRLYRSFEAVEQMPDFDLFKLGVTGHLNLLQSNRLGQRNVLTIIDFRKPSSQERLWVLDLDTRKVLFHTLVAHGKNSGNLYAEKFSNVPDSNSSSIGFFVTGDTYQGKHGLSLYLDGQEQGFNEKARERAIVMHGADYVSGDFVREHGRLGRSFGCPSVSMTIHEKMIDTIKGKTSLLIFYPDKKYLAESKLIRSGNLTTQLAAFYPASQSAEQDTPDQSVGN